MLTYLDLIVFIVAYFGCNHFVNSLILLVVCGALIAYLSVLLSQNGGTERIFTKWVSST